MSQPKLTKPVTITLHPRDDGGIRVSSDELRGLILSGADRAGVMGAILPAVAALHEYAAERGSWCTHDGYTFEAHGRCCPHCGVTLTDWGD